MKKLNFGGSGELLTKEQMKKVVGGDDGYGGSCTMFLACQTPNGWGEWCRPDCMQTNPTYECQKIYPKYGDDVSGYCAPAVG